jgi:hypothetical protein
MVLIYLYGYAVLTGRGVGVGNPRVTVRPLTVQFAVKPP